VINTTCFRCCKAPYNVGPAVVSGCWLRVHRRLAFSLLVFHSVPEFSVTYLKSNMSLVLPITLARWTFVETTRAEVAQREKAR
jgi:hypothetical protein